MNMKKEELRVGNMTKRGQIKSFIGGGVHFGFGECYDFGDLSPVPLTEEILLKCGFKAKDGSCVFKLALGNEGNEYNAELQHWCGTNQFSICRCGIRALSVECEHLHELQNLYYALTKEELDVSEITRTI